MEDYLQDSVTVEAAVEYLTAPQVMLACATNADALGTNAFDLSSRNELTDGISQLNDAMKQLMDGAAQLVDGASQLANGTDVYKRQTYCKRLSCTICFNASCWNIKHFHILRTLSNNIKEFLIAEGKGYVGEKSIRMRFFTTFF